MIPPAWRDRYGGAFLNRRENLQSNLPGYDELAALVDLVHRLGRTVQVTFNSLFYPPALIPEVHEVISEVAKLGPDGIIVADLGLLAKLRDDGPEIPINISGELGIHNHEALRMLEGLGDIRRITFQRHLLIEEMGQISARWPEFEYEAFLLNERCAFVGAHCFASHDPALGNYLCAHLLDAKSTFVTTRRLGLARMNAIHDNLSSYQKRETFNYLFCERGHPFREEDKPVHCGLCYVNALAKAGVRYLKVVGRGRQLEPRVKMTALASRVIQGDFDHEQIRALYAEAFPDHLPETCDHRYFCYY